VSRTESAVMDLFLGRYYWCTFGLYQ